MRIRKPNWLKKLFIHETIHEGNCEATRNIRTRLCLATPWGKIPLLSSPSQKNNRSITHRSQQP